MDECKGSDLTVLTLPYCIQVNNRLLMYFHLMHLNYDQSNKKNQVLLEFFVVETLAI